MQRLGAALSGLLIASALAVPATTATEQSVPSGQSTPSQEGESSLLLIMDASSSMLEEDVPDGRRIDAARSALHDMVAELPDDLPVGMRVFGANEDDTNQEVGCTDTELVLPVEPLDRDAIGEQIDGIQPRGFTRSRSRCSRRRTTSRTVVSAPSCWSPTGSTHARRLHRARSRRTWSRTGST